ncbi:MAG: DEAD/DEAH box helicase [Acidobacteriota bacterium]
MSIEFHPVVSTWFQERFGEPSQAQRLGWPAIQQGNNILIAAPTGSGKTLAAFLCAINGLIQKGIEGQLAESTLVVYISPLKALANDIRKNLEEPLEQIREVAGRLNVDLPAIRTLVRSGDTLAHERRKMVQKPPHILVTTPESLFILLTSKSGRRMLEKAETVIVDEIHALARDKRGSHLALSLERLEALAGRRLQRIGLSATQKPVEEIARFLTGPERESTIIDTGHRRLLDLAVEVPGDELSAVAGAESWEETYNRVAQLVEQHRTTLVFVNTRRLAERLAHHLAERVGEEQVATHHGSLAREIRLEAEESLKQGKLKVVVATASLELGIDIGMVDLVCQIGSTRSIALALQRIGRSGHWKGAVPKGRFFPMSRDELLECAALVRSIRQGKLDRVLIPLAPLDVLAQQIVAAASAEDWREEDLYQLFKRSGPYSQLERSDFDEIVAMLSEGFSTQQGRRAAYLHRDRINGFIRGRRGAGLASVTSGGAIPDNANYLVKLDPGEVLVGTLDEDFAVESLKGDIFLLGNTSWRIRRVEAGVVRVEDAKGAPPNIPFWRGEAPARTDELSEAVSQLREEVAPRRLPEAAQWLQQECGLDERGADQAARYVQAGKAALSALPTQTCVVAERFFDESGGMQLILHAPFGSRITKAWGLALRKRFCRSFNFELQAAATDNGLLLSLSEQHSFPLDSVFGFLSSVNVREVLVQALLAVPVFPTRWRWNASRALAVLRFAGGKKVPPPLQRMRSDDLLASVFPEQAACLENIEGDIEIPDHPLVQETLRDCLTEAMDIEGLTKVLEKIESGQIRCVAMDTREPSPFSHEIVNANVYAFLDDAPLEERRARAVQTRRTLPSSEEDLATLDPDAIRQVQEEVWPPLDNPDEIHDALLTLGILPESEAAGCNVWLEQLAQKRRAFRFEVEPLQGQSSVFWAATERLTLIRQAWPEADCAVSTGVDLEQFLWERDRELDADGAVRELLRYRMECTGPATSSELSERFRLPQPQIERALHALEAEGQVLRGSFRPGSGLEWCNRRLLARIHRLTLGRLRREIEPVSPADFIRFLFRWQHRAAGTQLHGERGLALVLEQLQGFESAAAAWETSLLPQRVTHYDPDLLDRLCLSGRFVWGRLSLPSSLDTAVRPSRIAPVTFLKRQEMPRFYAFRAFANGNGGFELNLSHPAREVLETLQRYGACFFEDLVRATRRLPVEVEEGLWELVAAGMATADGFFNLRALIDPKRKQSKLRRSRQKQRLLSQISMGRWTLLTFPGGPSGTAAPPLEALARQLLKRWGVIFRDLLARESIRPPWRDLLMIYRRLEARGEVRGGRFVSGFTGEQFALPEAVEALRTVRRMPPSEELVRISAADPLNLQGILTPGARIRPHPETVLQYRDGVPIDSEACVQGSH